MEAQQEGGTEQAAASLMRVHAMLAAANSLVEDELGKLAMQGPDVQKAYDAVFDARRKLLEGQESLERLANPEGRFTLGRVVATPGALALFGENDNQAIRELLERHVSGDWGDLDPEDRAVNENAVKNGARILSAYDHNGEKVWVITEADRSATTILTPEEY